jgi:hypothetical protein
LPADIKQQLAQRPDAAAIQTWLTHSPYDEEQYQQFREEIVKNHSGIRCQEIAGVNWRDREQVANYYKGEKFLECARIVGDTAKLTGELLQRQT